MFYVHVCDIQYHLIVKKNHKHKCWYKITSPPPLGSKKQVFKLRSHKSIVIAPAKTGSESNKSKVVTKIDHDSKGVFSKFWSLTPFNVMVVIKLIEATIDLIPARCSLKIDISTLALVWYLNKERGG